MIRAGEKGTRRGCYAETAKFTISMQIHLERRQFRVVYSWAPGTGVRWGGVGVRRANILPAALNLSK